MCNIYECGLVKRHGVWCARKIKQPIFGTAKWGKGLTNPILNSQLPLHFKSFIHSSNPTHALTSFSPLLFQTNIIFLFYFYSTIQVEWIKPKTFRLLMYYSYARYMHGYSWFYIIFHVYNYVFELLYLYFNRFCSHPLLD